MVIYTKRVNQISLFKNSIWFGWTVKPKVNLLKTLLTYINNALKQQKPKKKFRNDSKIYCQRYCQCNYNMEEVQLETWWLVGVILE